jgi:hypothetical protein
LRQQNLKIIWERKTDDSSLAVRQCRRPCEIARRGELALFVQFPERIGSFRALVTRQLPLLSSQEGKRINVGYPPPTDEWIALPNYRRSARDLPRRRSDGGYPIPIHNDVRVGQPDSSLNINNRHIDDRNRFTGLNLGDHVRFAEPDRSNSV